MSYRVRTESFEGPFDLLLYLVERQKVDIGTVSIAKIADQYLEEISDMADLDLDVASDFLLVASTLLEMKAKSLIPDDAATEACDIEDLDPERARETLVLNLIEYKKYKNAADGLRRLCERQGARHARSFGPGEDFRGLAPDYLEGVSLDGLACLCADLMGRRDRVLLESEHIAAEPIPVEMHVRAIYARLKREKRLSFRRLAESQPKASVVVVNFLAVLELYKRGLADVVQDDAFSDMTIELVENPSGTSPEGKEAVSIMAGTEEG